MIFKDRTEAGQKLADKLKHMNIKNPIVLALPRGGVPVAASIAKVLKAPLDVLIVRKLGLPFHKEVGFGAIAPKGTLVLDDDTLTMANLSESDIQSVIDEETRELQRRNNKYRAEKDELELIGKAAILVDDGLATGVTAQAAVKYLKSLRPEKIILAVPVAAKNSIKKLGREVDEIVVLHIPEFFQAVGQWYENFDQTSDETVINLLRNYQK